jgi:hypothetical protein
LNTKTKTQPKSGASQISFKLGDKFDYSEPSSPRRMDYVPFDDYERVTAQRDELRGLVREMELYLSQLNTKLKRYAWAGVEQPKLEALIGEARAAIANVEGK